MVHDRSKCIICGKPKEAIHHANGDHDDNTTKNLIPVCTSCHNRIHYGTTMQTLPWFAKLGESARRRTLPSVGAEQLEGQYHTAYLMDERLEEAYNTMQEVLAAESYPTGEQYCISGIDVNSSFANKFTSKIVSHSTGNVYEHRTTPVVLEKQSSECILQLPEIDKQAGGTTQSRKAYEAFLSALNKQRGLRGHGGKVTKYEP